MTTFDVEVEMETDEASKGKCTVYIQTSESEQEDHGDEIGDDSSVLDSSSDPPARHKVLSIGPGGGYTAGGGSASQFTYLHQC